MAFGLTELLKVNDRNLSDVEFTDILESAPLLGRLHAQEASNGTQHKYLKQTQAAGAGFRDLNNGIAETNSADTAVSTDCKLLDASFTLDVAYCRGHNKGEQYALDREGKRKIKSAFAAQERQILYGTGTGGNAAGHVGLSNNAMFDKKNRAMVVDAGGTTADTGTSVWLIRSAEDDVSVIAGNGGKIQWDESFVTRVEGEDGPYAAYYTPIMGWLGLQVGSIYCAVRICNLTEDANKGLTDKLIAKAIRKLPVDKRNNLVLAMSRRSEEQLQSSRTATTTTGAPAPFPTESHQVSIVVTDNILETEALLPAAS